MGLQFKLTVFCFMIFPYAKVSLRKREYIALPSAVSSKGKLNFGKDSEDSVNTTDNRKLILPPIVRLAGAGPLPLTVNEFRWA